VWLLIIGVGVAVWVGLAVAWSNGVTAATARQFSGEVVDRAHREVTLTTGMRHDYLLTVRTDDGEQITCDVDAAIFARFAVGDRIVKHAGRRWPEPA
jgi:hypothetical protein